MRHDVDRLLLQGAHELVGLLVVHDRVRAPGHPLPRRPFVDFGSHIAQYLLPLLVDEDLVDPELAALVERRLEDLRQRPPRLLQL